jgi:hypothetical protein
MVDASVAGVYVRREDGAAGKDRRFIDRFVSGSLIIGREASAPPLTTSHLDFGLVDKRTCFLLRSIGFFDHIQIDMRTVPTSPSRLALRSFCMPRTAQRKVLAYLGSPRFVGKNGPADRTLSVAPAASVPTPSRSEVRILGSLGE